MGVYINMEMPQSCEDCPMAFSANFGILCTPTHNIVGDGEISKKQNWCPLVPVPPHGRLGDLDKLADNMRSATAGMEHRAIIMHEIRRAPTVIEAEEVYGQYTDTAGNFQWCGTHSGEHTIKEED